MAVLDRERTFDEIVDNVRSWCRLMGTVFTVVETASGSVYLFLASPQGLSVEPMTGGLLDDVIGNHRRAVVVSMPDSPTKGFRCQFQIEYRDGQREWFSTSPVRRIATV